MRRLGMYLLIITMITGCSTGCYRMDEPPEETEQAIIGQIYDTGVFQVLVPESWQIIPITDPFAEGRPVKTDCVFLRKGGQSDWHVSDKPYIRIGRFAVLWAGNGGTSIRFLSGLNPVGRPFSLRTATYRPSWQV